MGDRESISLKWYSHRINNLKDKSDSNNFYNLSLRFLIPRGEQNWGFGREFFKCLPQVGVCFALEIVLDFHTSPHNPQNLHTTEHWVLYISLYAWINLSYMEFVTFTIKKSLFIIEGGQMERVQLKTSIRREGKIYNPCGAAFSIWYFPTCLPRLFFPLK